MKLTQTDKNLITLLENGFFPDLKFKGKNEVKFTKRDYPGVFYYRIKTGNIFHTTACNGIAPMKSARFINQDNFNYYFSVPF